MKVKRINSRSRELLNKEHLKLTICNLLKLFLSMIIMPLGWRSKLWAYQLPEEWYILLLQTISWRSDFWMASSCIKWWNAGFAVDKHFTCSVGFGFDHHVTKNSAGLISKVRSWYLATQVQAMQDQPLSSFICPTEYIHCWICKKL